MPQVSTFNDERKVVLITGCSSGIGRALAVEFAAQGSAYRVFASARSMDSLRELPSTIERVQLDVTDADSIKTAIKTVTDCTAGRIDFLFNNAGTNTAVGPIVETDIQRVRDTFEPNFFGLIMVTQAVTPYMIAKRSGTIVNIGSTAAIACMPFGATYSASKAAVHALSDAMRLELAGFGINVVVVAPGAIRSGFGDRGTAHLDIQDSSAYKHVEDLIVYRAQYSQTGNVTPAESFARTVRQSVTRKHPSAYLVTGAKSLTALLLYYLPTWLRDFLVGRAFSTWRIGRRPQ